MTKEYYIKEKEVKNNLNECLNDLSDEGLDYIIKNIDISTNLKTRNKKIEYLNKKIPEDFTNSLNNDLDFSVYRMFNSKDNKINDDMIKNGFMFHYHMEDKNCINVIPIELKEIFNNYMNDHKIEYLYNQTLKTIRNYLVINSYIPKRILKMIILSEKELEVTDELFDQIIKDNKIGEYKDNYTNLDPLVLKSFEGRKANSGYINIDIVKLNNYVNDFLEFSHKILEILNITDNNKLNTYIFATYRLCAFNNSTDEFFDYIEKNFKITDEQFYNIKHLVYNYEENIRYWDLNGRTSEEHWNMIFLEKGILNDEPKDNTILACLKEMNEDGINLIKEYYQIDTDDLERIKEEIINNFNDTCSRYDNDYLLSLILINKDKYSEYIYSDFLYSGFIFLYLDDDLKIYIPKEFTEFVKKYVNKNTELDLLVSRYLQLNGVIDIDILLDLINKNHNLDVTKEDIINCISESNIPFYQNKYLYLIEDSTEEDIKRLLESKKLNKDYKIVDLNKPLCIDELFEEVKLLGSEYERIFKEYVILPLLLGIYYSNSIQQILKQDNLLKYYNKLDILANKYKNKLEIWTLNGYTLGSKTVKVEKVGRNDPCPCGSGKKYKKCCGK